MTEERRENLKILYKNYHDENWERGKNVWIANSILVTGSLLIAFQPVLNGFPMPLVSLSLVIVADVLHATADKITSITYDTMAEIEDRLGINGLGRIAPREMFDSFKWKWWYVVRSLASYALYAFLSSIYLLLMFGNLLLSIMVLTVIFGIHSTATIHSMLTKKLKSLKSPQRRNKPNMDKDIDLVKIQILDSNFQSWFTFRASILAGGTIGLLILVGTLYYEMVMGDIVFYFFTVLIGAIMIIGIRSLANSRDRHLDFINNLLAKIEEGKQLPSLNELEKTKVKRQPSLFQF